MKKSFQVFILNIFCVFAFAGTGDTTLILSHSFSNLASPPSNDDVWTIFPNNKTYRKIIMKFTLGCGIPNCSGWDYTVGVYLGKKDGSLDSAIVSIDTLTNDTVWSYSDHVKYMEVARLITPYGTYMANNSNGFNNSWTHPYYFDVTDYAPLLKDSVNVRVHYSGWTDAFSARIEFILIEGTPPRTVESVREVYGAYISYPNHAAFESVAAPKSFSVSGNVVSAKLMLLMTGHGSQGEFDPHYIQLKVNNTQVTERLLWKSDCGMTAIAPQGGTWIFNRANWCPGEQVQAIEADITPYITLGQQVTVDLHIDNYTLLPGESAGYAVSLLLITYTTQLNYDVSLEEIIAPNNEKNYTRYNPIATRPIVKIKNNGKMPLTRALISYQVKGGSPCHYEWEGNLHTYESAWVTLPPLSWNGLDTGDRVFTASVMLPPATPDEFTPNNTLSSSFNLPPQTDTSFIIVFKTNNRPEENSLLLRNVRGDTLFFRNSLSPNVTYRDTLYLEPGSYTLDLYDYDAQWEGGDGISWWFNTQQGLETSGQFNLRKLNNQIIKNFNGDFGSNIHYEFTAGIPLWETYHAVICDDVYSVKEETNDVLPVSVFPNPASDFVTLVCPLQTIGLLVQIRDWSGKIVSTHRIVCADKPVTIHTGGIPNGIYLFELIGEDTRRVQKLVVHH
ncbi:MAG: peptide-N-glycosidase F-related protein [Chitinophagales bacterium]|nr:peptide-N-glycosidase F-related protein [Chitinophagales bacterium]